MAFWLSGSDECGLWKVPSCFQVASTRVPVSLPLATGLASPRRSARLFPQLDRTLDPENHSELDLGITEPVSFPDVAEESAKSVLLDWFAGLLGCWQLLLPETEK